MDGEIYIRAKERIAAIRAELLRLEQFVAVYEELAASNGKAIAGDEVAAGVTECADEVDEEAGTERRRATPQADLERIVEQVLLTHGSPLQRMDLLDRVKAIGVIVGGRNEATNFGSKLSRAARLVNLPKWGYWPKDKVFEPAGYQPQVAHEQVAA